MQKQWLIELLASSVLGLVITAQTVHGQEQTSASANTANVIASAATFSGPKTTCPIARYRS